VRRYLNSKSQTNRKTANVSLFTFFIHIRIFSICFVLFCFVAFILRSMTLTAAAEAATTTEIVNRLRRSSAAACSQFSTLSSLYILYTPQCCQLFISKESVFCVMEVEKAKLFNKTMEKKFIYSYFVRLVELSQKTNNFFLPVLHF